MENEFKTLLGFIAAEAGEASGRAVREPEAGAAEQLERFARGECSVGERAELCIQLRENPSWLRWLAARVKLARGPADPVGVPSI